MAGQDDDERASSVQRIAFSSDHLPAELDDQARFRLWHDYLASGYDGGVEFQRAKDRTFQATIEICDAGGAELSAICGTLTRIRCAADERNDDFMIGINRGGAPLQWRQLGREALLSPGSAVLAANAEPGEGQFETIMHMLCARLSRRRLRELVGRADDLVAYTFDRSQPAVRHLHRYLALLLEPGGIEDDDRLCDHIATTLHDLVALCLGAGRDAAELAKMRGLRAARVQEILAAIRSDFTDPAFSPNKIAFRLGLSARSVQHLLQETGANFTERVLELRLQKTRAMLADIRNDRLKVSEIAYACGFNDVSYFNRRFRARFGASPTQYRGMDGHG